MIKYNLHRQKPNKKYNALTVGRKNMKKNLYIAIAISIVILIVSFFILLELFFIEDTKVETYFCCLSDSDKLYHNVNCHHARRSYWTTVYQAERRGYTDGCTCSPFNKSSQTTLYLQEPHYLPPVIISIAIATLVFFSIKKKTGK